MRLLYSHSDISITCCYGCQRLIAKSGISICTRRCDTRKGFLAEDGVVLCASGDGHSGTVADDDVVIRGVIRVGIGEVIQCGCAAPTAYGLPVCAVTPFKAVGGVHVIQAALRPGGEVQSA